MGDGEVKEEGRESGSIRMAVLGRLALWACNPYSRRESGTQKHKTWFHSAVTVLKFLLILSLNLRFVSDIQWDNGVCI